MKLFVSGSGDHCVALFGSGLIGSTIERALCMRATWSVRDVRYNWAHQGFRQTALTQIKQILARPNGRLGSRCDIVWAAGVSGFGSSVDDMARETGLVAELCDVVTELARLEIRRAVTFHLISSGGGLFEGMTTIQSGTEPRPLRPYGMGKLDQERLVQALAPQVATRIYRPASVYGFHPGARQGLLATLIANTLNNRSTLISGTERTIRDYIFSRDIGDFVAKKIVQRSDGSEKYLLASGKPTTMFEAIKIVERAIGRPPYRRFESIASNARDLSFSINHVPPDLFTTSLGVGVMWLHRQIQNTVIRSPISSRAPIRGHAIQRTG